MAIKTKILKCAITVLTAHYMKMSIKGISIYFFSPSVTFATEQSFNLQSDTLLQECVHVYSKPCLTLEKAAPPTLSFSPGFAQGVIRLGKTAPCSPLCHLCLYVCKCVCELDPICVCACVPIFPPCGQVTITNQACEPCRKRPRKGPRKGGRGNQEGSEQWVLSFVLITEAKIKISKGMDGWRKGNRNLGINREWVFSPAMQRALNCRARETMLTFVFLSSFHQVYFVVLQLNSKSASLSFTQASYCSLHISFLSILCRYLSVW